MKRAIDDLALLGGRPALSEPLHVGRPNIGNRAALTARFEAMLDRRWLTNGGPCVQEFEERIASHLGVRHCIALCNATVGLEIAARALGLRGEVIVPSFTFVATAHALQSQGITPVFCDIDPLTHNIDPVRAAELITPRTSGIVGVHVWGRPCDTTALGALAQTHGLRLLYDAAHAFDCAQGDRMIGTFGDAEVLSFHATKFINAFEGGALVTNDDALADRVRLMHNFGFADYDTVVSIGTNGKMSEASAAMGLTSLDSIDEFLMANRANHDRYADDLSGITGINLVQFDKHQRHNHQYVVIEVDASLVGLSRDLLQRALCEEQVLARRYFYPGCHRSEPYRSLYPDAGLRLTHSERLSDSVLSLPTGTALGPSHVSQVCELIRFVASHGHAIAARHTEFNQA